jgi:hypothetical protein
MSTSKTVIRDSIRQVEEIYKQVSTLIESTDGFMKKREWAPPNNTVVYGSSAASYLPQQWLPSALTREYRNKNLISAVLMMGIVLDHDEIDEPLLVGTLMNINDEGTEFPYTTHDDAYYWFLKQEENENGLVEISDANAIYSKEKRVLNEIRSFALPLLDIENSDQLESRFVSKLITLISNSETGATV